MWYLSCSLWLSSLSMTISRFIYVAADGISFYGWVVFCYIIYTHTHTYIMVIYVKVKVAQLCSTLRCHSLYSPWNSPGQNTGVGNHTLLQGIFPAQGSNPGLPHCRQILYQLSHQGSLYTHTHTHTHTHIFMYMYTHTHTIYQGILYIYIYICICTHTHTHTHPYLFLFHYHQHLFITLKKS